MCYIKTKVTCPHCHDSKVVKNGKKRTGKQNFKCNNCLKQFQYEYQYRGADPKIREQLKRSLLHGSGIRDCSHIYGVSTSAVLRLILRLGQNLQIRPRAEALHQSFD